MIKPTIIVLSLIVSIVFYRQGPIENYFMQLRSGKSPNLPTEVYKPENAKAILTSLPVYAKDTMVIVRSKATLIARVVGTKSTLAPIRQQAVTQIIEAASDKSTGNAGAALNYFRTRQYLKLIYRPTSFLSHSKIRTIANVSCLQYTSKCSRCSATVCISCNFNCA